MGEKDAKEIYWRLLWLCDYGQLISGVHFGIKTLGVAKADSIFFLMSPSGIKQLPVYR